MLHLSPPSSVDEGSYCGSEGHHFWPRSQPISKHLRYRMSRSAFYRYLRYSRSGAAKPHQAGPFVDRVRVHVSGREVSESGNYPYTQWAE
jgi:hypothetical protein